MPTCERQGGIFRKRVHVKVIRKVILSRPQSCLQKWKQLSRLQRSIVLLLVALLLLFGLLSFPSLPEQWRGKCNALRRNLFVFDGIAAWGILIWHTCNACLCDWLVSVASFCLTCFCEPCFKLAYVKFANEFNRIYLALAPGPRCHSWQRTR